MNNKICVRCKKEVFLNDHYIKLVEKSKGEVLIINFMHKNCWDDLMDIKMTAKRAVGMMKNIMGKLGVNDEKIVEIK